MRVFKTSNGKLRKKALAFSLAAVMVLLVGGGVAVYAFWSTGGSGTGSASTGAPTTVTVVQTSTAADMYPGDAVDLSGNFDNPNDSPVTITAVTATIGTFNAQANPALPACTQADFTITGTSNTPGAIAPGTGVGAWSGLTITMIDSATNQDNCQNLDTVPIVYTAT